MKYQSRQYLVLLWVILPLLTTAMVLFDMRGRDLAQLSNALALVMVINLLVLSIFGNFQIYLEATELRWQFGFFGWPKWQLKLQDIRHVEVCETRWYEGKGIRFTREGMLYNAAGRGAVRIVKADGTRLRLGSAEPDILCAKIQEMMAMRLT